MRLHDEILSEEDFEQLPPALQRKYFSSLERLRLAQDASTSSLYGLRTRSQFARSIHTSSSHQPSLRKPSTSSSSTDGSFAAGRFPRPQTQHKSYLRKRPPKAISSSTTLIDPWDFAALPAAIQRKHFSPEEKYLIASRHNLLVLDAADEALYKQYQRGRASETSHPLDYYPEDIEDLEEITSTEESDDDMDANDMESLKWLDQDDDLDLTLDDYHAISSNVNGSHPIFSSQRRSFRRGLSFSNISFRRRSSSSTSLPSPQSLQPDTTKSASAETPHLPPSRHQRKESTSSFDAPKTHYQDPAAKMKLRVYLASPQKFDEALEFGFPSLRRDAVQSPTRPKTSPGNVNGHPKTFFTDDTPSLSEDESRDELSEHVHQDSPRTPIDMSFPGQRSSSKTSTDRAPTLRPRIINNLGDTYAHAAASDREMTLKMTLTRPELRALEETEHQPVQVNDTPLEKPPLTVPMGGTRSIWDDLPEEPSRVKRFFKKLKGRS